LALDEYHLFTLKLQKKKTVQVGFSIQNPNLFEQRLFGGNLGKVGFVQFNSSSN
jgi:hypothetical protein